MHFTETTGVDGKEQNRSFGNDQRRCVGSLSSSRTLMIRMMPIRTMPIRTMPLSTRQLRADDGRRFPRVSGRFDTGTQLSDLGDGKALPALFPGLIDQFFDRLMTPQQRAPGAQGEKQWYRVSSGREWVGSEWIGSMVRHVSLRQQTGRRMSIANICSLSRGQLDRLPNGEGRSH